MGHACANVGRLTAGASANVAARATRRRRSMMIAVFNRHSPDEQSLRRSVDLVNSSSFPALRKDGLGMRSYHLLPQNPVLKASTLSPFHPRRPVTIWASDRVSLSASRRALPCLHRGGYTTHTVRSSAARARTPQQTARTACNDLLDHLVGNGEQRGGYVEAVAVTDVDPTARPSAA